ncbi:hypothetical protein TIFTF001_018386 [Ficus carica]|uniref:Uncharacterized protein n=1 Tax=Ficus carica TaxID=3494 RepID=A0AA88DBM0_FICCA|nr:hypothetical protein TIFTF001_018386 [Ficus carica]
MCLMNYYELPNSTYLTVGSSILLGFNQFEGSIPIRPNVTLLSLRNILLSGSIPWNIGQEMLQLEDLYLSDNFLTGSIPPSIKEMRNLSTLDISSNKLSGELFEQWMGLEKLWFLDLSYNHLSGGISISICSQLPSLSWLKLGGNNLSGRFPSSFPNCTSLVALDLRENGFSGTIPNWVNAEDMASLNYLRLRSNRLHGEIPEQLCYLPSLHVLDLAYNNLSGPIPKCLGNGSVRMKSPGYLFHFMSLTRHLPSSADLEFIVKGRLTEYSKIVSLVNLIDLSCNNLSGEIPEELSNLSRLGSLNLSYNNLMGKIPEIIGKMQLLESLDLSWNHLSGPIPPSMTSMTALNYLNLSHNNLSGQIPSSNQFQTLNDQWIYDCNPGLCGPPLPTKCSFPSSDDPSNRDQSADEDDDHETLWFYASIALGYIVGFWAVCGTLLMNKSLRHAYFKSAYACKKSSWSSLQFVWLVSAKKAEDVSRLTE